MNLAGDFLLFINNNFPITQLDKTLLAVSGGPDSIALLHLFAESNLPFSVAHCNFGLRGEESDADEQLVVQLCQSLNSECFTQSFDTQEYAKKHAVSIQVAARDLRYTWFQTLLSTHRFKYIATAHHQDDQVETVLMNIIRGTGIKGLTGIPSQNGNIIRPLLFATKNELLTYLHSNNYSYRTDASNSENKYTRNTIRNSIIPQLNQLNPQASRHILSLSDHAKYAENILSDTLDRLRNQYLLHNGSHLVIDYTEISKHQFASNLLFDLIVSFGFNTIQCDQIHEAFVSEHTGKQFLSGTHELVIDRHSIVIAPIPLINRETVFVNRLPSQVVLINNQSYIFEIIDVFAIQTYLPHHLYLDADLLTFPLQVRPWLQGDAFHPLGSKGSKKVSDFLIDAKVNLIDKRDISILEHGQSIFGILSYRIDNAYRIKSTTQSVLHIYNKEENTP
jgi:tRNA(Ile)-lysidine synthase